MTVARSEASGASTTTYTCGDPVLNDQQRSGGEALTEWEPCWDVDDEAETVQRSERRAAEPQPAARGEAEATASLVACKGIPERELTHSPFSHRRAIVDVTPHRRGRSIRGVRVTFRQVPGLTAAWLEKSITCHQARHEALGRPATYLTDDPTLVEGADVRVTEGKGVIHVLVVVDDEQAGRIAYERAHELVAPKQAVR